MKRSRILLPYPVLATLLLSGCLSVNQSLTVADGANHSGNLSSVNGTIQVGRNATVDGDLSTVNGSVTVGDQSEVGDIETVNGRVELGNGVTASNIGAVNGRIVLGVGSRVNGSVETVNGEVTVGPEGSVSGRVSTVNGKIVLSGASAGSLDNYAGGMLLEAGSQVHGELHIKRPRRGGEPDEPVLVEIHAGCEVAGPLRFDRPVTLRIHQSATVGNIIGAEPEYFSE
ncbi:MAG: hypothetical protein LC637_02085 [Xanthomonadaceae bacterium]|nr:hypothetical protein [Xanthomonadaceae bacterium]